MIERTRYLESLIARKHNGMVKVITGVRRCGKSVLLTKLFRKHLLESGVRADRIVDIALDKRQFAALQDPDRLSEYIAARIKERAHLMENVIYNELVSRGYAVDVGVVEVWATENGKRVRRPHEIDFVVNDGSRRIYIQATFSLASEDQRVREALPLRKTGDFFRKIIVTDGYELPHQDADGIVHMGVIPFLLDPKSVEG